MSKARVQQAQFILWLMWQVKDEICMDGIPMSAKGVESISRMTKEICTPEESTEFKKGTCPPYNEDWRFPWERTVIQLQLPIA